MNPHFYQFNENINWSFHHGLMISGRKQILILFRIREAAASLDFKITETIMIAHNHARRTIDGWIAVKVSRRGKKHKLSAAIELIELINRQLPNELSALLEEEINE